MTVRGVGYKAGKSWMAEPTGRACVDRLPPVPARTGPPSGGARCRRASWSARSLLSAVVVGIVGWFLIQQTRDGLLEHRVDAVVQEAEGETEAARAALAATPGIDVDESAQQQALVEPIIARGCHPRLRRGPLPADRRGQSGWPTAAPSSPRASTWRACPETLEARFDVALADRLDLHRHPHHRGIPGLPEGPGVVVGSQVRLPADDNTYTLYYLYPLAEQEETLALVSRAMLAAGVPLLLLVAGLTWLVTRQVVTPIRMARRVAERLAAGQLQERLRVTRRGRPRPARHVLQPDGLQPAEADPPARGAQPAAAPVRLRRLPRAAYAASRPCGWPATSSTTPGRSSTRSPAGPPSCCRRSSTASRRCSPTCSRSAASTPGAAVLEAEDVNLVDVAHRVVDMTSALAAAARHPRGRARPRRALRRRGRRTPGRADRAQPRHQRHRPRRVPRRRDLRRRATPTSAAIAVRDHGVGPGAGGVGDGLQPVLARRPGARPHQRRHRARPVDLARGHPPARRLAPGLGASRRGCPVPADPAAPARRPSCGTARCRWSPTTPGRPHERQHDEPRAAVRVARVLGLVTVAACWPAASQMPTDGPVVEPQVTSGVQDAPGISFDPRPPQAGQSPPRSSRASSRR